ncbi:tryptophan-rich sensory protein [Patescibacteria group bacterium]|nr:tryptophan-rich sensory protein [Patescibacteria group bacterium]
MKLKINYFVIPMLVWLVAWWGGQFTSPDTVWYQNLLKPDFTPPGWFIGLAWTVLFILIAGAVLIFYNQSIRYKNFRLTLVMLVLNGFLNVGWSWLFFGQQMIGLAAIEIWLLFFSIIYLIILIGRTSRLAAVLLAPYAVWVMFAAYLNFTIWQLNF